MTIRAGIRSTGTKSLRAEDDAGDGILPGGELRAAEAVSGAAVGW